jgi:hypothetical protein
MRAGKFGSQTSRVELPTSRATTSRYWVLYVHTAAEAFRQFQESDPSSSRPKFHARRPLFQAGPWATIPANRTSFSNSRQNVRNYRSGTGICLVQCRTQHLSRGCVALQLNLIITKPKSVLFAVYTAPTFPVCRLS